MMLTVLFWYNEEEEAVQYATANNVALYATSGVSSIDDQGSENDFAVDLPLSEVLTAPESWSINFVPRCYWVGDPRRRAAHDLNMALNETFDALRAHIGFVDACHQMAPIAKALSEINAVSAKKRHDDLWDDDDIYLGARTLAKLQDKPSARKGKEKDDARFPKTTRHF
jgi:hypothetical protein